MISSEEITVSARFDTGSFMFFGVVYNNPHSYNENNVNIQSVYNLSFEDFTALEILICSVVTKYVKEK